MCRFIITKSSKTNLSLEDAYSGPSCEDADIPYGKIYANMEEAEADLVKLKKFNNISPFRIVKIK